MKKKGFTTVELVVSFALVITIAVLLFQVVLNLKNLYVNSGIKTQLLNKQALITNQINEKIIDKEIDTYSSCGEDCLHFAYTDGTSDDLIINRNEKYIEFNNNRIYLMENSDFGNINLDTFVTPVVEDYHNDSMLMIDIPIYYNKSSKQDFGIHIVYQYNSKGDISVSEPKDLVQELVKQYNESNTVGLLKDETGYYYKGTKEEVSNNFVWFGGHLWRVISIDKDNNLTMITQQPITSISPASAVWKTQEAYEASYINHWLNDLTDGVFLKSMEETDRNKIINSTFNVGIYNNVSEITTTQKAGLLDEVQYTKAGGKNSFLDIKDYFWLGNRYDTSYVRIVNNSGGLGNSDVANPHGVRPVIKISSLTFTGGKGTLDDPYRESSKTTSTANIKVGEYISISASGTDCGEDKRCLFRVVSKDSNSIKVILNGLLPNTSGFGSSVTYTSGNTVDTKVKAFANTINETYRYTGTDKTFGIGTYGDGANYTAVQSTRYTGNVGLPVIGEMFSGNDIDMTTGSTAKTFVNVSAIENPTVSNYFWTMNAYSTSYVRYVSNGGNLGDLGVSNSGGVRPVIILNASSSLTFASGEGTAESPFMLGS